VWQDKTNCKQCAEGSERGLVEDSAVSAGIDIFSMGTALKIALQKINLIL